MNEVKYNFFGQAIVSLMKIAGPDRLNHGLPHAYQHSHLKKIKCPSNPSLMGNCAPFVVFLVADN